MKTIATLVLGLALGYGASLLGQAPVVRNAVGIMDVKTGEEVTARDARREQLKNDLEAVQSIEIHPVGPYYGAAILAAGTKPNGDAANIRLDDNGYVICSPGAKQ